MQPLYITKKYIPGSSRRTASCLSTVLLAALVIFPGCKREEKFPDLGMSFAYPADVATSDDGQQFYAINSDFDRTYNKGSILVMDLQGNRLVAVETPRLGRSLTVAGNDMLVTYDRAETIDDAQAQLFDLTDPKLPKLVKTFTLPSCTPLNAVMVKNYKYFAVSCINGPLMVGELKSNRADTTLTLVREYERTRRALVLDTRRNLLYAFITDMGKQDIFEGVYTDTKTVTDAGETTTPNEVPDDWEVTKAKRSRTDRNETFQFVVYDLTAEAAAGFPYRNVTSPEVRKELRWLYFCLSNFDGTPDPDGVCDGAENGTQRKLYRANFWDAKPDPQDPNVFYLSHRGVGATLYSNDVVKVSINGEPKVDASGAVPKTDTFFGFERVYGFPGQIEKDSTKLDLHYPGDIEIPIVSGRKMLVVNHFRDLVFWKKGEFRFGLTSSVIGENFWFSDTINADPSRAADPEYSHYQVAVTPSGKGMSCSFYGNSVMLLDIAPGTDIKITKVN